MRNKLLSGTELSNFFELVDFKLSASRNQKHYDPFYAIPVELNKKYFLTQDLFAMSNTSNTIIFTSYKCINEYSKLR